MEWEMSRMESRILEVFEVLRLKEDVHDGYRAMVEEGQAEA